MFPDVLYVREIREIARIGCIFKFVQKEKEASHRSPLKYNKNVLKAFVILNVERENVRDRER